MGGAALKRPYRNHKETLKKSWITSEERPGDRLATCDGPPYYYKVAYEEAERMLEQLK